MNNIVDIENLTFSYENEKIFDNISCSIERNDFLAIIGPNGGGKTTFLKLLLGLLTPDRGKINFKESNFGYVPQNLVINSNFPIKIVDVILMGFLEKSYLFKYSSKQVSLAIEALEKVGLTGYQNRKIGELSGGQRQRVFIARAIVSNPKILFLDEPTSNIDANGQREIYSLLKELNKDMTIALIIHDITVIAEFANRVFYINRELVIHDNFQSIVKNGEHFCEVELLDSLSRHIKERNLYV